MRAAPDNPEEAYRQRRTGFAVVSAPCTGLNMRKAPPLWPPLLAARARSRAATQGIKGHEEAGPRLREEAEPTTPIRRAAMPLTPRRPRESVSSLRRPRRRAATPRGRRWPKTKSAGSKPRSRAATPSVPTRPRTTSTGSPATTPSRRAAIARIPTATGNKYHRGMAGARIPAAATVQQAAAAARLTLVPRRSTRARLRCFDRAQRRLCAHIVGRVGTTTLQRVDDERSVAMQTLIPV